MQIRAHIQPPVTMGPIFPLYLFQTFSKQLNPGVMNPSNQIRAVGVDFNQNLIICQFNSCQMDHSPSQTKTPKNKKNHPKNTESAAHSDPQQPSPSTLERYQQFSLPLEKEEAPREVSPHLPTIFRKHEYAGNQFTEIHDLRTGLRATRSKAPIKYTLSDFNEVAEIGSFLVNVSSLNSEQPYKKTQWKLLHKVDKFCRCARSECMKNYCPCHQKGTVCTSDCLCLNCKNRSKSEVYFQADQQAEERNRSRDRGGREQERECTKRLQQNDQGLTNVCACRRSKNCTKLYCGCYRLGINCSNSCGCFNCQN